MNKNSYNNNEHRRAKSADDKNLVDHVVDATNATLSTTREIIHEATRPGDEKVNDKPMGKQMVDTIESTKKAVGDKVDQGTQKVKEVVPDEEQRKNMVQNIMETTQEGLDRTRDLVHAAVTKPRDPQGSDPTQHSAADAGRMAGQKN